LSKVAFAEIQIEGSKVIVEDERAGKVHFGKVGVIVDVQEDKAVLNFKPGVDTVDLKFLGDLSEMKPLNQLQKLAGSVVCSNNIVELLQNKY